MNLNFKTFVSIFAALLLTNVQFANGQAAPVIQWEKSYGGSGADKAQCIEQTNDGGYIIAGSSGSNDGEVTGNHGSINYWITKLDDTGFVQWEKCYGGGGSDAASCIRQTSDGGYIIAGRANSNNDDVSGNHGWPYSDYWILKIDNVGAIQWEKSYGGSGDDFAYCIRQTKEGGYIVSGASDSHDGDVTGNHGSYDDWIVKLDDTGAIQWEKSYGGSNDDQANSIQQTSDGGYIVAGYTSSYDGDLTGIGGYIEYWILKLDTAGSIQWQKCYNGSGSEANCIQQTSDGGYIVAGYASANGGGVTDNHGLADYWVIKLDTSGTVQWEKSYGGSNDDQAYSVRQTKDGGYIIAGSSNSNNGEVTGNHGGSDYWIVKTDSSGNLLWEKSLGGSTDEEATSIRQTADGEYIVAGYSNSNDGDVTDNHGTYDYWIVKLGPAPPPVISSSQVQAITALTCGKQKIDTVYVHNSGVNPLIISSAAFGNGSGMFSLLSSAFPDTISAGDSVPFIIRFIPIDTGEVANVLTVQSNDSTHNPWQINFTGTVIVPSISIPQTLTAIVCPFVTDTIFDLLTNNDSISETLAFTSSCGLSQQGATLAPGQTDTLAVFLAAAPEGIDTCIVHVTDACNVDHETTIIENVQTLPGLSFTIAGDMTPVIINNPGTVYILAGSSNVSTGHFTFTISNEGTALLFDTAFTQWGSVSVSRITSDSLMITLQLNQPPGSDTLAVLYYHTYIGVTYTPYVRLNSETTQYLCESVSGTNEVLLNLIPACPYDSVIVTPYTSSLVSVYPNPVAGGASVTYSTVESAPVTIALYDALGRTVQTIFNGWRQPGIYNAVVDAQGLTNGLYFIDMSVGLYHGMMQMVLFR